MVRFCALRKLTKPSDLKDFQGTNGQWAFLPSESNEQVYTFKRNAQPRRAAADEKTTEKTSAPRTGRKRPR